MTDTALTRRKKVQGDAEHRAFQAWSMRVRGYSWREVAAELGYSDHSNAIRAVRNVFGDVPDIAGHREELRDLWRRRHESLWRIALEDAENRRPGAVRSAAAVSLAARQLDGLDAQARTEIELSSPEFEQLKSFLMDGVGMPDEANLWADEDGNVVDLDPVEEDD